MLVDLLEVLSSDSVRLHGALELPKESKDAKAAHVDVWMCIHGTGSNFYAGKTLAGLGAKLLDAGTPVLRINTRGHDVICTGPATGPTWLGAAFERVGECTRDLLPWIECLRRRGYSKIGLLGHSLGAVKSIFTLSHETPPGIAALVAISPPRLSQATYLASPKGPEFQKTFDEMQSLIDAGRGEEVQKVKLPLAYYVTPASFVDRYGGERFNVLELLKRVRVPTLLTYGTIELGDMSFRNMPDDAEKVATPENRLQVATIAGADHQYTGCWDSLADRIVRWERKL